MNDPDTSSPSIGVYGDLTIFHYRDGRTSIVRGQQREELPSSTPSGQTLPAPRATPPAGLGWRLLAIGLALFSMLRGAN